MKDRFLHAPLDLDPFAREQPRLDEALSRRVNADPEKLERGLAQLVLTVVELLRQLMERQALRRIDGGTLSEDEVERLGRTFMELDKRMEELRTEFGLDAEDLTSTSVRSATCSEPYASFLLTRLAWALSIRTSSLARSTFSAAWPTCLASLRRSRFFGSTSVRSRGRRMPRNFGRRACLTALAPA